MPASRTRLPIHLGEELRRRLADRRQRRLQSMIEALIALTVAPAALTLVWKPPALLVWNASASAPIGLYRVHPDETPARGDLVIAWVPAAVRPIAAERRYLPANVPLVKRVAATAGNRVCASGEAITINGRSAAVRQRTDAARRPIPWWHGCRVLRSGEYLLLMDSPRSFDGRYFGVTQKREIVGRATLLWAR
jgi:conjugative transfer signal peptidase TraF